MTLEKAFEDLKECFSLSGHQGFEIDTFNKSFESLTDPPHVAPFACRRLQAVAVLCERGRPVVAGQLVNNLAYLSWTLAQLSQHAEEPFAERLSDYSATVELAIADVSHYCLGPEEVFDDVEADEADEADSASEETEEP